MTEKTINKPKNKHAHSACFRDVVGQQNLKKLLISQVSEDRVSHAQLFLGPTGCGKFPLAMAYLNYLNCTHKQENDSCGECPSCKKNRFCTHPDVYYIYPYPRKDNKTLSATFAKQWEQFLSENPYAHPPAWESFLSGDKKQFVISVEESVAIMEKVSHKPFEDGYKIFFIWQPERMNNESANKLLKILEEPPPKTVFLLVSETPEKLLDTIISRTQILNVPRIRSQDMIDALHEKYPDRDSTTLSTVEHLSSGSWVNALTVIEKENQPNPFFDSFRELMGKAFKKDIAGMKQWGERMAKENRDAQKNFITYCLRLIRECFVRNLRLSEISYTFPYETDFAQKMAPYVNENNIRHYMKLFESSHREISANGNEKMIYINLSLGLTKLIHSTKKQ